MNRLTKTSITHRIMVTDLRTKKTINLRMKAITIQITKMRRDLLTKTITNQLMRMITDRVIKMTTNPLMTTSRPMVKITSHGRTLRTNSNCHLTMTKILSLNQSILTSTFMALITRNPKRNTADTTNMKIRNLTSLPHRNMTTMNQ